MKAFRNLTEVKKGLREVTSSACGTDRFIAQAVPLVIKELQDTNKNLVRLIALLQESKPPSAEITSEE